jgi:hypothetical protein
MLSSGSISIQAFCIIKFYEIMVKNLSLLEFPRLAFPEFSWQNKKARFVPWIESHGAYITY